ncbi:MAG: Leucyl aminopeptidase yscIV [Caeruleum heppii]|nr:MAG: Leucyl aminopeptidase yscIV [Caeruleum heppii]
MKTTLYAGAFAAFSGVAVAQLPLVQSNQLRRVLTRSALIADAKTLEGFAYATPERNRAFGGTGHNATVNWIYNRIAELSDYYTVEFQPFVEQYSDGSAKFVAGGKDQGAELFTYAPSGSVTQDIVPVANLGCNATDYPPTVSGKIALVSRGSCEFGLKSSLSGAAGAVGAVIYNNIAGPLGGTLGAGPRPEGPYIPTAGISQENGQALVSSITGGATVNGVLDVNSILENRTTYNVIAQTKAGDQNNVLVVGGHTDSVAAGPGINDNGSGTIGLLNVAVNLAKFGVNNAIRFTWFSAEEFGLLGAEFYVASLSQEERNKIRLYLNFDMIASPNYIYGIYDGDGSTFNETGPAGSAEAEKLFQDYFAIEARQNYTATDFSGRSDYGPFLDAGIASGGLFTGAEENKTAEDVAKFGGVAGVAYDENYHEAGDDVSNLNVGAFIENTKAIAHSIATYGRSFASLPPKTPATPPRIKRRDLNQARRHALRHAHGGKLPGKHAACGERKELVTE